MTTSLEMLIDLTWVTLRRALENRAAPERFLALATSGLHGGAEARMVVLRSFDRQQATLTIHTDIRSGKVAELARDPSATLLLWCPEKSLQVRFRGNFELRRGTPKEWSALSDRAQLPYGGTPAPGTVISAPDIHQPTPDASVFHILTLHVDEMDLLVLDPTRHLRARYLRTEGFRGHWIAP